jgi:competence protein ComEA
MKLLTRTETGIIVFLSLGFLGGLAVKAFKDKRVIWPEPVGPAPSVLTQTDSTEAVSVKRIHINTATQEQLVALPGIGPVMAKRIVYFRNKNGLFASLKDLQQVRGIGAKTCKRLEPFIVIK